MHFQSFSLTNWYHINAEFSELQSFRNSSIPGKKASKSRYRDASSDEFRIRLTKIRNSANNVEFEIRTRGRIWSLNSNSTKFDGRLWPRVGQKFRISPWKYLKWLFDQILNFFDQKLVVSYDQQIDTNNLNNRIWPKI